jgi:hypothetical protein
MRRHILLGSGPGHKFIHKEHLSHRLFHDHMYHEHRNRSRSPHHLHGGMAHKRIYDDSLTVNKTLGGKMKKMHLKPLKFKF